ncbi:MAG: DUF411 domain-containing protein [Proteobacteria bacterium]|nr:DUF411 domain-containing protein [Pseudomonadota bacterium]
MTTRRTFMLAASAMLGLGVLPAARAQQAPPIVTVYKSPACGCCGEWVKHIQASGFRVETHDVADMAPLKRRFGVPDELSSCHTAIVAGYTIEGHVPATDIKRLLRERTKAKGLAVPGMVVGSPGMEQGRPQPYATLVFGDGGSAVFERH